MKKYSVLAKRTALVALLLCNACAFFPGEVCMMDPRFAAQVTRDFDALDSPEMRQAIRDAQAWPSRSTETK